MAYYGESHIDSIRRIYLGLIHYGEPSSPNRILASAWDKTGTIPEDALIESLDALLGNICLRELDAPRWVFEAGPFRGWEALRQELGL